MYFVWNRKSKSENTCIICEKKDSAVQGITLTYDSNPTYYHFYCLKAVYDNPFIYSNHILHKVISIIKTRKEAEVKEKTERQFATAKIKEIGHGFFEGEE